MCITGVLLENRGQAGVYHSVRQSARELKSIAGVTVVRCDQTSLKKQAAQLTQIRSGLVMILTRSRPSENVRVAATHKEITKRGLRQTEML